MLVLSNNQISMFEYFLPPGVGELNPELKKIDAILDDPVLMEPFITRFNTRMGRPTVPVETFLRMMFLKESYQFGYETLVREVNDSLMFRRFCRIYGDKVPDATTLIKLTHKYGPEILIELNNLVITRAKENKVIKGRKLRVDTTVIEANIQHPTDAGLLADGIKTITKQVKKLAAFGNGLVEKFSNRTRTVKKRLLEIGKVLRRRTQDKVDEVRQITGKLLVTTEQVVKEAHKVIAGVETKLEHLQEEIVQPVAKAANKLKEIVKVTEKIINQTKQVQAGNTKLQDRIVSIFDQDARPIRKGKIKSPTEFGYKMIIEETEDRVIIGYDVLIGNPSDNTLLETTLKRYRNLFGRSPWGIAADRGFADTEKEQLLTGEGIKRVSIPRKGKKSRTRREYERQSWFRRLQKWRSGIEGTISLLKRRYGLNRSLFRGISRVKSWVGLGILTYNLRRLATLT